MSSASGVVKIVQPATDVTESVPKQPLHIHHDPCQRGSFFEAHQTERGEEREWGWGVCRIDATRKQRGCLCLLSFKLCSSELGSLARTLSEKATKYLEQHCN